LKKKIEEPLRTKLYEGDPEEAKLFMLCAKANLKLGYLIVAEGMIKNCLKIPNLESEIIVEAKTLMGNIYEHQG